MKNQNIFKVNIDILGEEDGKPVMYGRNGIELLNSDYEISLENDCLPDEEYFDRPDQFYRFRDQDNCRRVYEEILKL